MKRLSLLAVFFACALLLGESLAVAQPPGGRPGQGGGRQGGGRQGGFGGGRGQGMGGSGSQQTPPMLRILDTDGDGELSSKEIESAAVALQKLDQNRDGKLTAEEFRSIAQQGLQGQGGGGQGFGQGGGQRGAGTGMRPGQGGAGQGRGGQGRGGQGGAGQGRGASQGRGGQASRGGRPRDRERPRDIEFKEKFPIGAELPADLKVYNVDRELVPINSIFKSKYTVIVGGCLTCPEYRNSYPEIEAVARDFKGRDVDFYFLYQSLTHPENWGFVQPSSIEDRFAQVEHAKELLQTQIPWLTDTMENRLKTYFVLTPNSQFVFDQSGKVVHRDSWGRGSSLRESLETFVGKPETLTSVADLNLPRFERHLARESDMLVERVKVEGKAIPLRVESGGKSSSVAALRSIDFEQNNRYAKLRPEADQQLIETGSGKLYLGFRQDPVLGASWNNLASPPEYKIVAEGATVSPATGQSKRLEVESDNEPREFLVDVKNWNADKPISVKLQYFACNKEKGWCKSVQQEFTIWLDEDESAGMVNGRSHFPGGRGSARQGGQGGGGGRGGAGQRPGGGRTGQRPSGQRPSGR